MQFGFSHVGSEVEVFRALRDANAIFLYTANVYRGLWENPILFKRKDCVFCWETLTALTGLVQGFPCVVVPQKENPVFISWDPVMKTGLSLMEILHRGNPVLITGMGLQRS